MYAIDLGSVILVEQNCIGTGVFDGTDFGKAKLTLGVGISQVRISAFKYGTDANNLLVEFVDGGAGTTRNETVVDLSGSIYSVHLRRNPGAILATATEVALAINKAFREQNYPIVAIAAGSGVVVPVIPTPLTGGINPVINEGETIYTYDRTNLNGGLFTFENKVPLIVRQFEAKFQASGLATVKFSRINLNSALEPIPSTEVPFFVWDDIDVTKPDISTSDVRVILHPYQAIKVSCLPAFSGLVRIDVRKEANFPYL